MAIRPKTGGICDQSEARNSELDTATGLQYNRARWYDPAVGRWLSQDPIGFEAGDANLYRYVGNQLTTKTDASGLEEEERFIGFIYTLINADDPNDVYIGKAEIIKNRLTSEHKHKDLIQDERTIIKLQPVFAKCDPDKLTNRERTRILLDAEQTVLDANGGVDSSSTRNTKNELTEEEKRKDVQERFKPRTGKGGTINPGQIPKRGRNRRGSVDPEALATVATTLGLLTYLARNPELMEFLGRLGERGIYGVFDPLWDEKIELEERYAPHAEVGIDGATGSGRVIHPKP